MARLIMLVLAVLLLVTPLAAEQQRPKHLKLFRPEDLDMLEVPDRDVWQRPEPKRP